MPLSCSTVTRSSAVARTVSRADMVYREPQQVWDRNLEKKKREKGENSLLLLRNTPLMKHTWENSSNEKKKSIDKKASGKSRIKREGGEKKKSAARV